MYQELRDGEGICVTWSGIAGLKITPGVVAVMGMLFSVRSFLFVTGQITQNLRGIMHLEVQVKACPSIGLQEDLVGSTELGQCLLVAPC